VSDPTAPASEVLGGIAERLGKRPRGLSGMSLGLTPTSRF
jgi:ATP-binding protein involved in chromosome partitioning